MGSDAPQAIEAKLVVDRHIDDFIIADERNYFCCDNS